MATEYIELLYSSPRNRSSKRKAEHKKKSTFHIVIHKGKNKIKSRQDSEDKKKIKFLVVVCWGQSS